MKTVITAHRGAAGYAPENTLAAIREGIKSNAERIEVDVQQTKDHEVVLLHDDSIDRTTDGSGKIDSFNYKDLMKFSAGGWFSGSFTNEKIPLLEDAMMLVKGKAEIVIEIKEGNERFTSIEERIIHLVEKLKLTDKVIIHSFNNKILQNIFYLNPKINLHQLYNSGERDHLLQDLTEEHDRKIAFCSEISIHKGIFSPYILKRTHQAGKKLNVWTVNSPEEKQQLINAGVDGIITDYP
jgi:glycerophosphoryl diester phosphodiesterase